MALIDDLRAAQLPPPGERRRIRQAAGATLKEFADELGVSPMAVLRWERGDAEPRRSRAAAYRRLLDTLRDHLGSAA
jgi:transcriptional regulator with XRE-family HTH domain